MIKQSKIGKQKSTQELLEQLRKESSKAAMRTQLRDIQKEEMRKSLGK